MGAPAFCSLAAVISVLEAYSRCMPTDMEFLSDLVANSGRHLRGGHRCLQGARESNNVLVLERHQRCPIGVVNHWARPSIHQPTAREAGSQWEAMLGIFRELLDGGMEPSPVTFTGALPPRPLASRRPAHPACPPRSSSCPAPPRRHRGVRRGPLVELRPRPAPRHAEAWRPGEQRPPGRVQGCWGWGARCARGLCSPGAQSVRGAAWHGRNVSRPTAGSARVAWHAPAAEFPSLHPEAGAGHPHCARAGVRPSRALGGHDPHKSLGAGSDLSQSRRKISQHAKCCADVCSVAPLV